MQLPAPELLKEQPKIYFTDVHGEAVLLTPAQMLILKTITADLEKDLKILEEVPPELLFLIFRLVEAEHDCNNRVAKKLGLCRDTVYAQLQRAKLKLGHKSTLQLLLTYCINIQDHFQRSKS